MLTEKNFQENDVGVPRLMHHLCCNNYFTTAGPGCCRLRVHYGLLPRDALTTNFVKGKPRTRGAGAKPFASLTQLLQ